MACIHYKDKIPENAHIKYSRTTYKIEKNNIHL
jgi:hypothetical protein